MTIVLIVVNFVSDNVAIAFNGGINVVVQLPKGFEAREFKLIDYDNDGWLDVFALGNVACASSRNLGANGFRDVTARIGLDKLSGVASNRSSPLISTTTATQILLLSIAGSGSAFAAQPRRQQKPSTSHFAARHALEHQRPWRAHRCRGGRIARGAARA